MLNMNSGSIKTNKRQAIDDAIVALERQYPRWPSTFSSASCQCQDAISRGGGKCAGCCERDLAALVGIYVASEYHQNLRRLRQMEHEMMDGVGE